MILFKFCIPHYERRSQNINFNQIYQSKEITHNNKIVSTLNAHVHNKILNMDYILSYDTYKGKLFENSILDLGYALETNRNFLCTNDVYYVIRK